MMNNENMNPRRSGSTPSSQTLVQTPTKSSQRQLQNKSPNLSNVLQIIDNLSDATTRLRKSSTKKDKRENLTTSENFIDALELSPLVDIGDMSYKSPIREKRRETIRGGADAMEKLLDDSLTTESTGFQKPTAKPKDRRMTVDANEIADVLATLEDEDDSTLNSSIGSVLGPFTSPAASSKKKSRKSIASTTSSRRSSRHSTAQNESSAIDDLSFSLSVNQENDRSEALDLGTVNPRRETIEDGTEAVEKLLNESLTTGSIGFQQSSSSSSLKSNNRRMTADAGDIADMIASLEAEEGEGAEGAEGDEDDQTDAHVETQGEAQVVQVAAGERSESEENGTLNSSIGSVLGPFTSPAASSKKKSRKSIASTTSSRRSSRHSTAQNESSAIDDLSFSLSVNQENDRSEALDLGTVNPRRETIEDGTEAVEKLLNESLTTGSIGFQQSSSSSSLKSNNRRMTADAGDIADMIASLEAEEGEGAEEGAEDGAEGDEDDQTDARVEGNQNQNLSYADSVSEYDDNRTIDTAELLASNDNLNEEGDDNGSTISSLGSLRSFLNNSSIQIETSPQNRFPSSTTGGLKSCLSSTKKIKPRQPLSTKKSVVFGSPSAVEFNKSSPTTKFTPMKHQDAKLMFSMDLPPQPVYDAETEENSRILEQWDRLTNASDSSFEEEYWNDEIENGANKKRSRERSDVESPEPHHGNNNNRRHSSDKSHLHPETPPKKGKPRRRSLVAIPSGQNSSQFKRRRKSLSYVKSHSSEENYDDNSDRVEPQEEDSEFSSLAYSPHHHESPTNISLSHDLNTCQTQELPSNLMELMNQKDIKKTIPTTPPSQRRESISTPLSELSEGMPLTTLVHSNAFNTSIQEVAHKGQSQGREICDENPLNSSILSVYSHQSDYKSPSEPTRTIPLENNLRSLMETLVQGHDEDGPTTNSSSSPSSSSSQQSSKSSFSSQYQLDSLINPPSEENGYDYDHEEGHNNDDDDDDNDNASDIPESLITSNKSSPIVSKTGNLFQLNKRNDDSANESQDFTEELETNLGKLMSKVLSHSPSPSPSPRRGKELNTTSVRKSPMQSLERDIFQPLQSSFEDIPEEDEEREDDEEDDNEVSRTSYHEDQIYSPLQSSHDPENEPDIDVTTSFLEISFRQQPSSSTTQTTTASTPKLLKRLRNLNSGRQSLQPTSSRSRMASKAINNTNQTNRGVKRYSLPGPSEYENKDQNNVIKSRQSEGIVSLKRRKSTTPAMPTTFASSSSSSTLIPSRHYSLSNFLQFLSSLGLVVEENENNKINPNSGVMLSNYSFLPSSNRLDSMKPTSLHQFISTILHDHLNENEENEENEALTPQSKEEYVDSIIQILVSISQAAISECHDNQLIPTTTQLYSKWLTFISNPENKYPALQLAYDAIEGQQSRLSSSSSSSTISSLSSKSAQYSEIDQRRVAIQHEVSCCIHNSLRQWLSLETKLIQMCSDELLIKREQLCEENEEVMRGLAEERNERRKFCNLEKREEIQEKQKRLKEMKEEIQVKKFQLLEKKKILLRIKEEKKNYLINLSKKYEQEGEEKDRISASSSVSSFTGVDKNQLIGLAPEPQSQSQPEQESVVDGAEVGEQGVKEKRYEELVQQVSSLNEYLVTINHLRDCSVKCYQSNLISLQFNFLKNYSYLVTFKLSMKQPAKHSQHSSRRTSYRPSLGGKYQQPPPQQQQPQIIIDEVVIEKINPKDRSGHEGDNEGGNQREEEIFCFEYCQEYLFNEQRMGPFSQKNLSEMKLPSQIPQFIQMVTGYIVTLRSSLSWLNRKNLISRSQIMNTHGLHPLPSYEWYWQIDTSTSCCKIILSHAQNGVQIDIPLTILVTGDVNLLPIHLLADSTKIDESTPSKGVMSSLQNIINRCSSPFGSFPIGQLLHAFQSAAGK